MLHRPTPEHHDFPQSVANPVWFCWAHRDGSQNRTGIYHADPNCSAIEPSLDGSRAWVYELDRATPTALLWVNEPNVEGVKIPGRV